jgi:flavodoxin
MASNTTGKARLLVAYFSYTGNTKRIAQALVERLQNFCDIEIVQIVPTSRRCYLHWLAYSFVPDSQVDIENPEIQLSHYDIVLLGFPKWTFSCPPINKFIHRLRGLNKPKFYLFMTSGGFDEQRYLDSFARKLVGMGCDVVGSLMVKRRQIQEETFGAYIESFVEHIQEEAKRCASPAGTRGPSELHNGVESEVI